MNVGQKVCRARFDWGEPYRDTDGVVMSDKNITIIGTLASVLGLVLTLYAVIFTEYKVISLISLILFETIGLIVWVYFVKAKNRVTSPYEYENECLIIKYTYETERKAVYEVIGVIRVTAAYLSKLPIWLFWTGKGDIRITSDFTSQDIEYSLDGKSGSVNFNYPISRSYKFGDSLVIHYKINFEDTAGEDHPELSLAVRRPTKFCAWEVTLKYKDTNSPALFSYVTELAPIPISIKIKDVNFDEKTKSYRINIPKPLLHHTYKLNWVK